MAELTEVELGLQKLLEFPDLFAFPGIDIIVDLTNQYEAQITGRSLRK